MALPPWTRQATIALAVVLLLTLALAAPPLAKVGSYDHEGNRRYRAYFTADFVWHMALTTELTRFALPRRNPAAHPEIPLDIGRGEDDLCVATDRATYPEAAKFDVHPEYFVPVFRRGAVAVYAVSRVARPRPATYS